MEVEEPAEEEEAGGGGAGGARWAEPKVATTAGNDRQMRSKKQCSVNCSTRYAAAEGEVVGVEAIIADG